MNSEKINASFRICIFHAAQAVFGHKNNTAFHSILSKSGFHFPFCVEQTFIFLYIYHLQDTKFVLCFYQGLYKNDRNKSANEILKLRNMGYHLDPYFSLKV